MSSPSNYSISVNPVSVDNIVDANEEAHGFPISGTTTGYSPGDVVTVKIWDSAHNVVKTYHPIVGLHGSWEVDATGTASLSDGQYKVEASISQGSHHSSADENITLDKTPPEIVIAPVTKDNIVTPTEDAHGFKIHGTVEGANGQPITVAIIDPATHQVVLTETAVVHGGHWKVHVPPGELALNHDYVVRATVSDEAGNRDTEFHHFETSCFMAGTLIRTPEGEVAVETLKRGDMVATFDGRAMSVAWIGRQTISARFADPLRVLPVRIKAGALGDNLPARDLLLSPDHALLIDDVLVQAGALVNGMSIVREADVPQTFTYYHVELDDHSLVLAENTPAETFIDNVDRMAFDNWQEHEALYRDGKALVEMPYPRAKAHRQVPKAIRDRLAERCAALHVAQIASAA